MEENSVGNNRLDLIPLPVRIRPLGEKASDTGENSSPLSLNSSVPVGTLQTSTPLERYAEAKRVPSGEKARTVAEPRQRRRSCPAATSQSRRVLSDAA